jgi:hypothetical protein
MPEIGQLSGSLEKKEYGYKPRSRVYAGPDWGWQTEESYDKIVQQRNRGLGSEAVDFIEEKAGQAFGFISQIPGVKQGLQFAGGVAKFVDQTTIQPAIQAAEDPSRAGTPEALIGTVFKAGQMAEQGGAQVARNLGVDPRIGSAVAGAAYETVTGAAVGKLGKVADTLTPPGGGMTPALAGGASISRQTVPQIKNGSVMMSTTSPEWTAKGMGQNVATTPKYAPAVKVYNDRRQAYADKVKELQQSFEGGQINAARLKKTLAKVEKIRKGDASTFEYDPKNPYAYKEGIESSFNPYLSTPEYQGLRSEAPRGLTSKRAKAVQTDDPFEIGRKAQQHHILAKAETKPFADTLNKLIDQGIGDPDDLVNFFVWPEQYDLFPGNTLNNLLDMGEITHTVAKKDPMALHKILAAAGLEFGSGTEKQIIKRYGLDKIETVDELMQAYDRYLREIAIPSKELTYKIQDWWYNKTIQTLKGKELEEFKRSFAKLNDPRRR